MILEQKEKKFSEITITIQTREELDTIQTCLNVSEYSFKKHMSDCISRDYDEALQTRLDELRTKMWSELYVYYNPKEKKRN